MSNQKTFHFHSMGCKLNFAESSSIGKQLIGEGFRKSTEGEKPDICIINTCTVTDTADKKCRQVIKKLHKDYPNAYMIVTGCYSQLKPDEIANIEGVNLVLGANDKFNIPEYLKHTEINKVVSKTDKTAEFYHSCSTEDDRTRHFLKVQDGCDYFCTYCAIPYARGRSRNGKIEDIVNKAKEIAANGGKEIILSGVNIGDFGKSTGEKLIDLITQLDKVEGIERFRISSIEPDLLYDEIIDFIANSKRFAPHFHLPLQSGSDNVLQLMKRHYNTTLFKHKIKRIKELMPNAFIGIDVIVGMRGESEQDFNDTHTLLQNLDFSELHVFSYSERAGTKALNIPNPVHPNEKKRRSAILLDLSKQKLEQFYKSQIGFKQNVLWEDTNNKGIMHGFTENYIKLKAEYNAQMVNQIESLIINENNLELDNH